MSSILDVQDLKTYYFSSDGVAKAVDGISFKLERGGSLGLAGESGCGKTTAALSLVRLIKPPGRIIGGKVLLDGEDILGKSKSELDKIRWKRISIVFQGAMNALNPTMNIESQIMEPILFHTLNTKREAKEKALRLLKLVGVDPSRGKSFPFELSGGLKQRVMIAMSVACDPEILIADEPTTALDVLVQRQVLKLIKKLQGELKLSMILISHSLPIISQACEKVAIMYAGKFVEYADIESIFEHPAHPYTISLIASLPSIKGPKKIPAIMSGIPPDLRALPSGCAFHPRCRFANRLCNEEPPSLVEIGPAHYCSCHRTTEIQ